MKTVTRQLFTSGLAALLALCAIRPADAQGLSHTRSVAGSGRRVQPQNFSATDIATFQTTVGTLVNWLQAGTSTQQSIANDLQTNIAGLTSDQMAQLASNYDVNGFTTAVTTLVNTVPAPQSLPPSDPPATLFAPKYMGCDPRPGGPGEPQFPSDPATIMSLDGAINFAKAAKEIADKTCDSLTAPGTNIPNCILAVVVDLIEVGLETTKDILTACDSNIASAQTEAAWQDAIIIDTDINSLSNNTTNQFAQVTNQLTSISASLNSHETAIDTDLTNRILAVDTDLANRISSVDSDVINKSTAVDTDLNNHLNQLDSDVLNRDTQIDSEISTFQTLNVRVEIERSLAGGLTIGLFEVPLANGGYLETVRSIVNDTISKLIAAGQTVSGATKYLGLGDTAFSAKQYKSAYANYLTAYQTAVK